jgi:hypothetical protein
VGVELGNEPVGVGRVKRRGDIATPGSLGAVARRQLDPLVGVLIQQWQRLAGRPLAGF